MVGRVCVSVCVYVELQMSNSQAQLQRDSHKDKTE